jgi:peroxiredoxin
MRVAETYRNLDSFRSVVVGWTNASSASTASYRELIGGLETEVAESRPGKVRVSNKGFLLVSDGETTWTYLSGQGEYSKVNAAPLLQEGWRFCPNLSCQGWNYAWIYAHPVPPAQGASLRGEQSGRIGGRLVDCHVITVPVSYRLGPLKPEGASEELWVDKSRFIVWHDQFAGGWVAVPTNRFADGNEGGTAYNLKELAPGPVPEETFHFDPPAGAKRVESMTKDIHGLQPWLSLGTFDPPEATLDPTATGKKGPDFALQDLNGKDFRLNDLRGTIAVLNFWASWCKPCPGGLGAIQKLHDELASRGVVFLGIEDESAETVKSFVTARGYTFPMMLDTGQTVHQLYGVRWAPTTVVINRKGRIAAQYIGAGGEAQLRGALKSAGLNTTP